MRRILGRGRDRGQAIFTATHELARRSHQRIGVDAELGRECWASGALLHLLGHDELQVSERDGVE